MNIYMSSYFWLTSDFWNLLITDYNYTTIIATKCIRTDMSKEIESERVSKK